MTIEDAVSIDASPEQVYRLVMDPHRLEDWVAIHDHLEDAPDGELARGSELTQCLMVAGQQFKVRWRVAEDDCPRRVVWEGRGPLRTRARVLYQFEQQEGGTRFSYVNEYEMPGGPAGRIAGRAVSRAARREMRRSLDRLRNLLEQ